jgi:SAM-dependent methyltransferase
MSALSGDKWDSGDLYEPYVGRWSRQVARGFLRWLGQPPEGDWLDVGCGTGALTETILALCQPRTVTGIDPSAGYIDFAKAHVGDERVQFRVVDAQTMPIDTASFDAVVSGLVLNYVFDPRKAAAEMRRVARPDGVVAAYVWDYAGKMELMRYFWDAAVELNPKAADLDEGRRFQICKPDRLESLFRAVGLREIETTAIDVPTVFSDFDDYWSPFLGGQAPAPGYNMSLSEAGRIALRELLRRRLPIRPDGSIHLVARGWAVKGRG